MALALALAVGTAGCGAGDRPSAGDAPTTATTPADGPALVPPAEAVEHVHGIGVDPGDGAIVLATHTGLFRIAPGTSRAERVGDEAQDTMGFTVIGPGRYLGSGHPAPGSGSPPHLGLIASDDGGLTWRSVSLLGEADFHLLRAAGGRIVAVDALSGAQHVSDDDGESWRRGTPPDGLIDLAIDPADADHLVATTAAGGAVSRDAGRTWSPAEGAPGFLGWPAPDELVRMGEGGAVSVSTDGGRSWEARGSLGEVPAAFLAVGADVLLAATHDGRLLRSADLGVTWSPVARLA